MIDVRRSFRFLAFILAVAVGNAVAHLCTSAMPLQVGALIEGFGLSATAAGLVSFFQVGALAFGMIVVAPVCHRYPPAGVCFAGLALAATASVALFLAPPFLPLLCLLGASSGFGYCLMLTATVAAPAGWPQPDRVYAASSSGGLLILVVLLTLLPLATARVGPRGVFLGIALLFALCTPLLWGFRYARREEQVATRESAAVAGGAPLIAMWALVSLGAGAMWTFAERIGHALALPGPVIGTVLSVGVFLSLIGSGLAAVVGGWLDRRVAIAIGLFGTGASCLLLALATGLWTYAAAVALYWIFTIFFYVLMLGTAAAIDPSGRLATLGTGCERLAFAVGAPLGGLFVDLGSFLWIALMAVLTCSILAPLFLPGLGRAVASARLREPGDAVLAPVP